MILTEDTKATVAILIAAIALIGVIFTAIVSFLVSRRATYLNTVTTERSKWIDKLRDNISRLIAQARAIDVLLYRSDEFQQSKEYDTATNKIVPTMALIRLQLNPDGKIDKNILALMTAIQSHVGRQDYQNLERLFVRHVQWLLKEEWEKVKFEARGWFGRLWAAYKLWRRKAAYAKFCSNEGAITGWCPNHGVVEQRYLGGAP
jgi:hypothetical protein